MGLQPVAAGAVVDAAQHRGGPVPHLGRPGALVPLAAARPRPSARSGALVVAIVIRMAGATGEKKERAEALLAHQALHDMLTGLPNRAFFYERTDEALEPQLGRRLALRGDAVRPRPVQGDQRHHGPPLRATGCSSRSGPRVETVLRGGDTLARLGGDEFCVLLPDVADEADAVQVAERIIAVLEEPFEMDGANLGIEASCGISMAPADGETADLLLQRADVAMYVAKDSQASVVVYTRGPQREHAGPAGPARRPSQRRGAQRVRPALPAQGGHGHPAGRRGPRP